ncbi:MAG TPA: DUF975 family protein [Candidatus Blautia stercoravium]|nr:DUF975 family protein [Candidatus Blautia stercoravium]
MEYGPNWNRAQLKIDAKAAFKRNYGTCVLVGVILSLLSGAVSIVQQRQTDQYYIQWGAVISISLIALLVEILVWNVFAVGGCRFFVENRDYSAPASKLLFGFQGSHYGNVVWVMFLMGLKIFLWTLLLIIPGIIKAYEYMMVPYILAEQPDINQADAFAISRQLMMNQKFDAFVLQLSFIGWYLLAACTCGIVGIFWSVPYYHATEAELYAVLRNDWLQKQNPGYDQGSQGENL